MEFLVALLVCLRFAFISAEIEYGIPGIPDKREMKFKISRNSGMGPIHPGYILLALLAFTFFVIIMGMVICYKRDKDKKERKMFLIPY
ncbi:hypothetical protein CEXT_228671 [Caerostris extrusa]|uniref:Uncharacterized protein n=1 Tax=Caerostris extrusa TaxID=172846 RepID=A0AAV4MIS8_CAEEX|nr:hypothetical protein CEXT_228671 [Caerostris extrusa]